MNVRNATRADLIKIAKLHINCFPESFSSQLGEKLLAKFYLEYLEKVPELFFIAETHNEIVGLCMGYYCENNMYQRKFLRHNFFRICIRCLILTLERNVFWLKKIGWYKTSEKENLASEKTISFKDDCEKCGDLLSICVKNDHRGSGVASMMVREFHNALKKNNRKVCFLSVKTDNSRAVSFYKKMGYSIVGNNVGSVKMRTEL